MRPIQARRGQPMTPYKRKNLVTVTRNVMKHRCKMIEFTSYVEGLALQTMSSEYVLRDATEGARGRCRDRSERMAVDKCSGVNRLRFRDLIAPELLAMETGGGR